MAGSLPEVDAGTRARMRAVALLLVAGSAVVVGSYQVGSRHPAVTVRYGQTTPTFGAITAKADGRNYEIPTDVSWVGADGGHRSDGRPECLPPVGTGPDFAVTFATIKVRDPSNRRSRDLTISVDCSSWDASMLTPEQAENARVEDNGIQ